MAYESNHKHNYGIRNMSDQRVEPTSNDVLCEKGQKGQRHPGNIHYHTIISKYLSQYQNAQSRSDKDKIALSVFHEVPGKFLAKHEDGKYYIVSQKVAVEKIKQAFRDRGRDRANPGQKGKQSKAPIKSPSTSKSQKKDGTVIKPIPLHQKHSPIKVDKDMKRVLDLCKSL